VGLTVTSPPRFAITGVVYGHDSGEFFGEQRLADYISSAAARYPAPKLVRRLMRRVLEHQADQWQDDASIVVRE
jgi:serine phosphatase RsbU (regulator of sigma subunit)